MGLSSLSILVAAVAWLLGALLWRNLKLNLIQHVRSNRTKELRGLFLLWLGSGAALLGVGGAIGRPGLGLLGLLFVPRLFPLWYSWCRQRERDSLDGSSVSFFHALHGLIRAGLSLPSALFQLSENLPTPFGLALQKFLQRYEKGTSLQDCLSRFRQSELKASAGPLALLEMAYRNGLPVAPLLEKMIPVMEAEQFSRARIRSLARASLVQASVAFALPWLLAGTLGFFQPALIVDFTQSSLLWPMLVVSLGWEALGVLAIWRISKFY